MLRGYRLLTFAACVGLAFISFGLGAMLVASDAQEKRYAAYRYAADKPEEADPSLARVADTKPFEYRTPCKEPKGKDESDLCAQWRAAYAAEDSASWTKWGLWVAIAGTAGLFWTLYYTRKAVEDTGDATKAMLAQNEISKYAQRPWIEVEIAKVSMSSSSETFGLTVDLILRNRGHTPALNIRSRGRIIIRHGKQEIEGEIYPGEDYTRIVHNLLPGGSGYNSVHPKMPAKLIPKTTIRIGGQTVIDGPYFVPTLEIKVDYEWGDPIERGRTVKRFSISAVDPVYHERDERLGIPITLGAIPVTPLKAIEVASPEIS